MATLTIDGQKVESPDGSTVIQAAEKLGIFVPRYCYHPGLSIAGNCRICLVDVEKNPKLKDQFTMAALDPKSIDPLVKKNAPDQYGEYQADFKKADELFEKAMAIKKEVEAKAESKGVIDPNK